MSTSASLTVKIPFERLRLLERDTLIASCDTASNGVPMESGGATMNVEEDEKFLFDKLVSAKESCLRHRKIEVECDLEKRRLNKIFEDVKTAYKDYMEGNGLLETDLCVLFSTESIDCSEIAAVPERYIRVKETKEVNKALLKKERPQGNYYTIVKNQHIKLKSGEEL